MSPVGSLCQLTTPICSASLLPALAGAIRPAFVPSQAVRTMGIFGALRRANMLGALAQLFGTILRVPDSGWRFSKSAFDQYSYISQSFQFAYSTHFAYASVTPK
jgi:hypothetical protein